MNSTPRYRKTRNYSCTLTRAAATLGTATLRHAPGRIRPGNGIHARNRCRNPAIRQRPG